MRFNDGAAWSGGGGRFQIHHFRLQKHHLEQVIDSRSARCRNFADDSFAAPIFRGQVALLELLLHLVDVRRRQIDFVNCHHDFDVRRGLGVIDRLDRLRHDTIVCRHNQDDNVGDVRTACAHRGKRGVTGRVDERDVLSFVINRVSTDVLSDSAGLARCDSRFTDRIHQRRFAVIDVAHESDDRCARFKFLRLFNDRRRWRDHDLLNLVHARAFFAALFFENESVALGDLRRDVGLDRLIDVRENIECHQLGDELMRFQTKLGRKLLHNDRRLDVNDFLCRRLGSGWSRFNHG